jgi:hypothetical protein
VTKPNLRVLKWLGTIPAVGVCTACDVQFKVPTTILRRVADAQESLRKQFVEHKCRKIAGTEKPQLLHVPPPITGELGVSAEALERLLEKSNLY